MLTTLTEFYIQYPFLPLVALGLGAVFIVRLLVINNNKTIELKDSDEHVQQLKTELIVLQQLANHEVSQKDQFKSRLIN